MRLMPDFLVRSFIFLLTHTLYRLKVTGEERIPDHGPALLVSNHASFVDGFMISACTSRRIRFLMHEDYYQIPLLNPFARFAGFIEVPRLNRIKSMSNMIGNVKDALRQGDIVCVFPEGKITRNGIMDEFRGGFKAMLPDDVHVPVIPVRIGMIWGSIFSYYYGRLKLRFPKELPHPVTISFGKPVPHGITAYELRQTISELAADTDMTPRPSERPPALSDRQTCEADPVPRSRLRLRRERNDRVPVLCAFGNSQPQNPRTCRARLRICRRDDAELHRGGNRNRRSHDGGQGSRDDEFHCIARRSAQRH